MSSPSTPGLQPSAFSLLQEPPRPWLEPDALKAKFLRLSAPLHPDRVHHLSDAEKEASTRRFAELNAAWMRLRDPCERINLLLELETGARPRDVRKIPPGTMDLFMEVGQLCRDLDAFLASREAARSSPLLHAAAVRKAPEWLDQLEALRRRVEGRAAGAEAELRKLDTEWAASGDHKPLLERLENLGRFFSYLRRWIQQIEERRVQLK